MCQCPRTGNLHFYYVGISTAFIIIYSVNALVRATYISTKKSEQLLQAKKIVSMPSYGQLTFLPKGLLRLKKSFSSVNALVRATYISTRKKMAIILSIMTCVNALVRATYISTKCIQMTTVYCYLCQCPRTGNLHFYCTPSKGLILSGFLTPILQVIHRKF